MASPSFVRDNFKGVKDLFVKISIDLRKGKKRREMNTPQKGERKKFGKRQPKRENE